LKTHGAMLSPLAEKQILVTGGTGTFGHAFVRRALEDGAERVVVFSRDELKQAQMRAAFPDQRMRFFIGDVRDRERLRWAMRGVNLVVHAAALKRIETCEENPLEAVHTNIVGTGNVAQAAIIEGVERAIFLSTDKAPAAHTLYGATKMTAERLWLQSNVYAAGGHTVLSAVRYGNILGSRGSVLDIFTEQAKRGEPITITDPGMTRFWMTIDQAADLVCMALGNMRGGEIFIPKAPSSPIGTLVDAVAGEGAAVKRMGLRGSERLHETLITPEESHRTYDCHSHYVIEPEDRTWGEAPPVIGYPVPAGFTYRSDTNELQYSATDLRRLIA
jgi:UDP-N-acetylglucosamine 4,6-dehydratase